MVLRAYFDASKTNPYGVTVIGGHIGTEDAWAAFEKEWQGALDYWKIPRFHLTDLPTQLGKDSAQLCVRNFARILGESDLVGLCSGIRDEDWDALIQMPDAWSQEDSVLCPTRYHFTLDILFGLLSMQLGLNLPAASTLVTLDADAPSEPSREIFRRHAEKNELFEALAILEFPRNRIKPLEAADLLAGIRRRDWAERGFESERGKDLYGPITWDDRARWNAGGKGSSHSSMWSLEIARMIAASKAATAADVAARALKASEEE